MYWLKKPVPKGGGPASALQLHRNRAVVSPGRGTSAWGCYGAVVCSTAMYWLKKPVPKGGGPASALQLHRNRAVVSPGRGTSAWGCYGAVVCLLRLRSGAGTFWLCRGPFRQGLFHPVGQFDELLHRELFGTTVKERVVSERTYLLAMPWAVPSRPVPPGWSVR